VALTDAGTVQVFSGATLNLENMTVTATGGSFQAGGTIYLENATINGGTLTSGLMTTVIDTTSVLNGLAVNAGSSVDAGTRAR
jgi:hypothetical protein